MPKRGGSWGVERAEEGVEMEGGQCSGAGRLFFVAKRVQCVGRPRCRVVVDTDPCVSQRRTTVGKVASKPNALKLATEF